MQFVDDAAILATSRSGAIVALKGYIYIYIHVYTYNYTVYTYMKIAACFSLSLNVQKTKLMVTGREAPEEDRAPIHVAGGDVECVTEFQQVGMLNV